MGTLRTPNTGEGTTNATPASRAARATREGIEDHQIHDLEESDSEPEPTSTKNSFPNPEEQPQLVHRYSLRGGDRLSRDASEILLPQH